MSDEHRNLAAWLIFTTVMLLCLLAVVFDILTSNRTTLLDVIVTVSGFVAATGLTFATRRVLGKGQHGRRR